MKKSYKMAQVVFTPEGKMHLATEVMEEDGWITITPHEFPINAKTKMAISLDAYIELVEKHLNELKAIQRD